MIVLNTTGALISALDERAKTGVVYRMIAELHYNINIITLTKMSTYDDIF